MWVEGVEDVWVEGVEDVGGGCGGCVGGGCGRMWLDPPAQVDFGAFGGYPGGPLAGFKDPAEAFEAPWGPPWFL